MKAWKAALAIATMVALTATAAAQCKSKRTASGCDAKPAAKKMTSKEAGRCWGQALVATGMPLVTVKVGDATTQCPEVAHELIAKNPSVKPVFSIGDKEYSDCNKLTAEYEAALQSYLADMTQVRYAVGSECVPCPNHAQTMADAQGKKMHFRVASYNFDNREKANRASKIASEAAGRVTMKMVIDGKEYDCNKACFQKTAGCCADKADCKGDKKSCCDGKAVVASDKHKKGCCADKAAHRAKTTAAKKRNCCDAGKATAKTASAKKASARDCDKSKCGTKSAKTASASGCCPKSGNAKQVIAGKNCEYIVGEQKTSCEQTARINLLQARIVAAYRAVSVMNGQNVAGL